MIQKVVENEYKFRTNTSSKKSPAGRVHNIVSVQSVVGPFLNLLGNWESRCVFWGPATKICSNVQCPSCELGGVKYVQLLFTTRIN